MILDTNTLCAFIDGDVGVGEILRHQAQAAIPVIVLGEFRYGIAQSKHRSAYEAWLEAQLPSDALTFIMMPTTNASAFHG